MVRDVQISHFSQFHQSISFTYYAVNFFLRLRWFSLFKVPAITLLQRRKDVGLIQVPVVTSLRRVKLVTLTQVPVVTSLRRLKLVGFIYVTVKRPKDVSNRSVSLTYQLRRRDDVLAWSATSQPICDLNEMLLQRHMPGGKLYLFENVLAFLLLNFLFHQTYTLIY